jgi:uncharacterized membrane protein YhaH (DUF805 family)
MEKKRSKGVTIFAWLIIIGSILSILSKGLASEINPQISTYFYYFVSPISIIIGIYLLRLKDWARTGIIAVSIMVGIETLATSPYCLNRMESTYPGTGIDYIIAILISLGFNCGVIYFFTRPKVKAQFSPKRTE